jgi:hypothetical protein
MGRHDALKRQLTLNGLHGVIAHKAELFKKKKMISVGACYLVFRTFAANIPREILTE